MEALLQLKPVTHNKQLRALRSLYDKIESHVRTLKALGVTSLPSDLRLTVSKHVIEDDWELDTPMKQIEKEPYPGVTKTAVTTVYGNTDQVRARIILDGGSQRSYVNNQLRSSLNLKKVHTNTVPIKTFGSSGESTQVCAVVELKIGTKQGEPVVITAISVPLICEPICGQPIEYAQKVFGYLSKLELADTPEDTGSSTVDMLIGSDYYWRFVTERVCCGTNGPVAIHTKLGWVHSGPITVSSQGRTSVNLVASTHVLRVDRESPPSHHCKRLHGLLERLRKNPELLTEYNKVIQEQLSHGIVELASELPVGGKIHYLPHHAVIRRDKETTKVCVAYDASAQSRNKPSLNHCLYKGPPFGQAIFDILRFRVHQTAIAGDIKKAFLMVSIAKKDREALRFLWVDDPMKGEPNIIPLRFTRVVLEVSSSLFLLNATIVHHLDQYVEEDSEFVAKIKRAIYVDDVRFGSREDDSTFELYEKSKRILAKGGISLRKFITNLKSLHQRIQDKEFLTTCTPGKLDHHVQVSSDDQSYSKTVLGANFNSTSGGQKIIGVYWKYDQDQLEIDLSTIAQSVSSAAPTKRDVVSITAKFLTL
uniref:DUF1758 domain-containing protein n=1 Tax=Amphimedon queenslandica TaxID=400682 RepID=A0A1X7UQR4_AMPQE